MKGQMYRLANQNKIHQSNESNDQLTEVLDNKLHYLNRSFEHNLLIQEIYLDIIKNKKTIHAKELKQYYRLFTNSKAESLMFDHQIRQQNQNFELNQNNKEMTYALKRLYCRLIQKIMVKISYYLLNKPSFNFVYAHASQLIKKCETLMRRLNHLKDLSNINEVIDKIFQENQEFQEYIFHQLIYKGYINSVDEFYRINGIDLQHRDVYERNKETSDEGQSDQEIIVERKVKFKAKYESNLNKEIINSYLKKEAKPINESKNLTIINSRAGMIELQNKYKELIISIDKIITQEQFEQIAQVKQPEQNDKEDEISEPTVYSKIIEETSQPSPQPEVDPTPQNTEKLQEQTLQQQRLDVQAPEVKYQGQRKITKLKKQLSKKSSQIFGQQYDTRSELHKQQITILSMNSSSIIPDTNRQRRKPSRKYTSPFFSKSFVNAIKSIQKSNLTDQSNRLSIKRMSENIIQFQRQSEKDSLSFSQKGGKQKMTMMHALQKSNQKKSIIKLLNIYKNRTLENFIGQARKQLYDASQGNFTQRQRKKQFRYEKSEFGDKSQRNDQIQCQSNVVVNRLSRMNDDPIIKRKILRNQTKQSIFKQQSTSRLKHLEVLKSQLKKNSDNLPKTQDLLKNFQYIESKIKTSAKASIFQNFRLSQKVTVSNMYKVGQRQNSSLRNSPEKQQPLQSTSILTSNGIQSIDLLKYNKQKVYKLNKTVQITPTQTPLFPHFEVYDRIRRVMIK